MSSLAVKLNGRRVGTITRLAGEKQFFAFEQDYLDDPGTPDQPHEDGEEVS